MTDYINIIKNIKIVSVKDPVYGIFYFIFILFQYPIHILSSYFISAFKVINPFF